MGGGSEGVGDRRRVFGVCDGGERWLRAEREFRGDVVKDAGIPSPTEVLLGLW